MGLIAGLIAATCGWSGSAAAQGNNVEVSCSNASSFTGKLCQNGNNCSGIGFPNNPTDLVKITGVVAGTQIKFTFNNQGTFPNTTVDINGQGLGNSFSQLDLTVNPPPSATSNTYVVTALDAGDGASDFQIHVDNASGPTFAAVDYSIMCTPPPAPTLKIVKSVTNGDGTTTFNFNSSPVIAGSPNPFASLLPGAGNASAASGSFTLVSGTAYTITEAAPPAGWTFNGASCVVTGGGAVGSSVANGVAFTPQAGQNIVCTFSNQKGQPADTGTIVLQKTANAGDGATTFNYTSATTALNNLSLTPPADGTAQTPAAITIAAGSHTISEVLPAGWTLNSFACSNGTGSLAGTTGSFSISGGQNIVCTFTNTRKRGGLVVRKAAIGGNGNFDFAVTGPSTNSTFKLTGGGEYSFLNTPTGQYTISETSLPAGWTLQAISCGVRSGNSTMVSVVAGQTVTCTFTNFKEKDDRMEDVTKVFIHRRVDNLLTHGPDRARLLRRLEEQPREESLKDGPLKLQSGASQPGMAGGGFGMTGLSMGSAISRAEGPYVGPNGTGMIGAGRSDEPEAALGDPLATSRMSGLGAAAFNQLGNAASGLSSGLKFSASLSELRATMQAAEESKAAEAARKAEELGFGGQPYMRPITGMRQGLDVWIEGQMSRYDDSTGGISRDGDFKILYVGADYTLSSRVLVGTLVQFDLTNEDVKDPDLTGRIDGRGWMAGPYIGIKLTDHLFFDARAAWGTSDNDIMLNDPEAGRRTGNFETTRWLASATLTGNWYYGPWRITPQVGVAFGHEEYDAYKNSLKQTVDGASASIGRATLGTELGYRIMTSDGTLVEPHVGITGIWNFDSDDLVINGAVVGTNSSRAKVEGGVIVRRPGGMGLRAAVAYDGIGDDDFGAWTGQVWLNLPLN